LFSDWLCSKLLGSVIAVNLVCKGKDLIASVLSIIVV